MRVGDLFSGIGGFSLAARWMGWETAWFSEIDPYASAVLAKHWPGVPNHGDINRMDFTKVKPVDMLCGGFPCQDLSNAGKRAGIGGERSGLWSEYARAIRELRPRYVVVENVAALLGRGLERVLGDLAEIGYDAEWEMLSAADVGAPHLRERIWIVAYPERKPERLRGGSREVGGAASGTSREVREQRPGYAAGNCGEALANSIGVREPQSQGRRAEERGRTRDGGPPSRSLADPAGEGQPQPGWAGTSLRGGGSAEPSGLPRLPWGGWESEPDVGRVAHGVPARVDRLAGLGNALVPQIAEWIGRRILAYEAVLGSSLDAAQRR